MKQHDLLRVLCETYPNVFTITLRLKAQKVIIDVNKAQWQKVYEHEYFKKTEIAVLAKEILREYRTTRNL